MDQRARRTNPTNSGGVAANNDNIMPDHVLEVSLDEERLLVNGFDEMTIESDTT
jgi:hypothetical protein